MAFRLRYLSLKSISRWIIKGISLYAIKGKSSNCHNFTLILSVRFTKQFFFVEKYIMAEKIIKIIITTRKMLTVICNIFGIRHHESVIYKTIFCHCKPLWEGI